MRARLAVLAVAGLLAVLGVTAITASGAGHETEVRITAQRLADGRTEFALQQRELGPPVGEPLCGDAHLGLVARAGGGDGRHAQHRDQPRHCQYRQTCAHQVTPALSPLRPFQSTAGRILPHHVRL